MPKRTYTGKIKRPSAKRFKKRLPKRSISRARLGAQIACHRFKRWANDARDSVTGTTYTNALTFQLSDVRGSSEFNALYDRYMITCVIVKFRLVSSPTSTIKINDPNTNVNTTTFNTTNWYPCLYYCKDNDDSTAETLAQLQERAYTKRVILQPNKFVTIKLRPCVTIQAYNSTLSTGYVPKWNQWLDCAQTGVPHYGLKYCIDTSAQDPLDSNPFIVERSVIYYFKCKDSR